MCFKRDEQTKPFAAAGSTSYTSFFLSIAKHKKIKNRIKKHSGEGGNNRRVL